MEWLNTPFTIIDTGGIEPESRDIILSQMREQAQVAIETADVNSLYGRLPPGAGGCGRESGGYAAAFQKAGGAGSEQGR